MKLFKSLCLLYLLTIPAMSSGESTGSAYIDIAPKANEVFIGRGCIKVPVGNFLLIRKDDNYCALKFIRLWTENGESEKYAVYKVYYQGNGTGDFAKKDVLVSEGRASELPLRGPFRPFIYQPGDSYVEFGPYKLGWQYNEGVCFIPVGKNRGDLGFEIAPTPWTEISEVDAFDPRIKWFRYDQERPRQLFPIEQLWSTGME